MARKALWVVLVLVFCVFRVPQGWAIVLSQYNQQIGSGSLEVEIEPQLGVLTWVVPDVMPDGAEPQIGYACLELARAGVLFGNSSIWATNGCVRSTLIHPPNREQFERAVGRPLTWSSRSDVELRVAQYLQPGMLIQFPADAEKLVGSISTITDNRIESLERELDQRMGELADTQENLRVANESVQATRQELQSVRAELAETSQRLTDLAGSYRVVEERLADLWYLREPWFWILVVLLVIGLVALVGYLSYNTALNRNRRALEAAEEERVRAIGAVNQEWERSREEMQRQYAAELEHRERAYQDEIARLHAAKNGGHSNSSELAGELRQATEELARRDQLIAQMNQQLEAAENERSRALAAGADSLARIERLTQEVERLKKAEFAAGEMARYQVGEPLILEFPSDSGLYHLDSASPATARLERVEVERADTGIPTVRRHVVLKGTNRTFELGHRLFDFLRRNPKVCEQNGIGLNARRVAA